MAKLYGREWLVQVDNIIVRHLPIEFKIVSSIKSDPNKCVLTVWNLTEAHRAQLLKRNQPNGAGGKIVGVPVQIEAGYQGNTSVLFSGDLRECGSMGDRTDWKTVLSGDDSGRAYREARINKEFGKGTAVGEVFRQCAQAMGVGLGNVGDFVAGAEITGIGKVLAHPKRMSGSVAVEFTTWLNSMGLTWSVQRGALQILTRGKPLNLKALRIAPDSGLIGSPQASIDASVSLGNAQQFAANAKQKNAKPPKPKDPGILKLKTFLIPGLVPGRKIVLESRTFNGGYMVTEVEYVGQSFGTDWHCNLIARVY